MAVMIEKQAPDGVEASELLNDPLVLAALSRLHESCGGKITSEVLGVISAVLSGSKGGDGHTEFVLLSTDSSQPHPQLSVGSNMGTRTPALVAMAALAYAADRALTAALEELSEELSAVLTDAVRADCAGEA